MREVINKIAGVEQKADKIITDARTAAAQLLSRTDEELTRQLREARERERERGAVLQSAMDEQEARRVREALEREGQRHAGADPGQIEKLARKVADRIVHTVFDDTAP